MEHKIKLLLKKIPGVDQLAHLLGIKWRTKEERLFLLEAMPKQGVCAEIGIHLGDFSAQILAVAQPSQLYLIDPWAYTSDEDYKMDVSGGKITGGQAEMNARYERVRKRFAMECENGQVKIIRADSETALNQFADDYFDWIYIDGNHTYNFVKSDLALAFQKTKTGGYITGDDYHTKGFWKDDVIRAVDEFVVSHPVKLEIVKNNQFVISNNK